MTDTPHFQPSADGYDDAVRRMVRRRHRRRTFTTVATASATLTLGAVLLANGGVGGLVSLKQEQPAGLGGSQVSSSATPTLGGTPTPAPGSTEVPTSQRFAGSLRPSPGGFGTSPSPDPQTPGRRAPASVPSPPISTTLTRTEHAYRNTQPCADSSGRASAGWCVQFPGPYQGQAAHPTSFTLDLCRLPAFPDGAASFASTAEAQFALSTTGQSPRQVWSFAAQHAGRAARHQITVPSGQCLSWALTWWNRDDHGAALTAGDYTLAVEVAADNIPNPNQVSSQVYSYHIG